MLLAYIEADKCVGCTKCLDACPVDAIVGAPQMLHTVLDNDCIGCKLCIPPCPMDCIKTKEHHIQNKKELANKAKERYKAKMNRIKEKRKFQLPFFSNEVEEKKALKADIDAALQRVKKKNADE